MQSTKKIKKGQIQDFISDSTQTALNGKENSLGFTPENVSNKATDFTTINDTLYPSVEAVKEQLDLKLDKDTTAGVERAYIINADGSQGTKATSEFGNSELYRSWFSYMANNAGAMIGINTGNPLTVYGTGAVVPRSGTTVYGSLIMNNYASAATNGSNAGIKNNNSGDGSYLEGVEAYFIFANNSTSDQQTTAVGLYSLLLAVPNLNPSNFTANTILVGNDVGDANLSIFVNRINPPASFLKINCGALFPANTTSDAYLLKIDINKTLVETDRIGIVTLTNLVTGAVFSHTFTGAQLPSFSSNLAVMINRGNRNSAVATSIRAAKIHVTRKLF